MTLRIYNTISGKKEVFQPIEPNHVRLYVCGITSYDFCHVGHARSALAFDMIVKYFRYRGYKVTYVRNFTDVDDKIIARAAEQNTSPSELANRFIDEFYTDMDALGIDRPDIEPKATEHITEMITLISELVAKGIAYQSGNDVYFAVDAFENYGKLSHRKLEDMMAGARISVNELKKNPMDFVLWKGSKPGEPKWQSPWGDGRPGWHIECSAMSRKYLGKTFDIHGGGKDLIFPHHENELAQSEAANCCPFVNLWIHHGFVTIKDEKMSKSLNNFLTIREILRRFHPEVLRFFIFSTHYRNPLDFSETAIHDAAAGLERLYTAIAAIDSLPDGTEKNATIAAKDKAALEALESRFQEAMDNDFNTAQAQSVLFDGVKIINRLREKLGKTPAAADVRVLRAASDTIKRLGNIMGILRKEAQAFLKNQQQHLLESLDIDPQAIEEMIAERNQCRAEKNWAKSDAIRDKLLALGIELKDTAGKTSWQVKRTRQDLI